MWKKIKTLLKSQLAKVATKRFGYRVTFDSEDFKNLGLVLPTYNHNQQQCKHYFLPSEEVAAFLQVHQHHYTEVKDVRSIDFIDLGRKQFGGSIDNGLVEFIFKEESSAVMFRLQFLTQ